MMIVAKYLFVLVSVGAAITRGFAKECHVEPHDRKECGWVGIDEHQCTNRGCCWNSTQPNAKYCFFKSGVEPPEGFCPVAPSERVECGYYGISKEECVAKQCCWDDTMPNTKWCFKDPKCNIQGSQRYECGWLGMDETLCNKRGCCWDSSNPNAKYCFLKKGATTPEGRCPVAPSERKECGYYGIKKEECLHKQCCWDDTVPDTKWCFKQPEETPLSCYIYHGISGTCRYTCAPDDKKMYGMGECKGKICCYKDYPSKET